MANVVPIRRAGTAGADELLAEPDNGSHLVHFYEDDQVLLDVVARFVGTGVRAGERALVIATEEHARGIAPHPAILGGEDAVASGHLLLLDANETLDGFMLDGLPDPWRFREVVGGALDRLTGGAGTGVRVRAFTEMVDVLSRRGQWRAVMQLEQLWNTAVGERGVSLLCGYVMSSFYDAVGDPGEGFADVCRVHTHVLPPESFAQVERSAEPLVEISRLSDAARLAAAERRFRLLVANVFDYAVFMLDPRGTVVTWNAGAERIKGWKTAEIVGRHYSVLHPPQDAATGKCDLALLIAAEQGRYEEEGWRVRKDGTFFWAHIVITALREGSRLAGFAQVTRDMKKNTRLARGSLRELQTPVIAMQVLMQQMQERNGSASDDEMDQMERHLQYMSEIIESLSK